MQMSAVLQKFARNWAANGKGVPRPFKIQFDSTGKECLAVVEARASVGDSKYVLQLVTPIVVANVEEELFGACLDIDGLELAAGLEKAEPDDQGMLELVLDINPDEEAASAVFDGSEKVMDIQLGESLKYLTLPDYNEEHDVHFDEEHKLFSFTTDQGLLTVCNTLDDFSVFELQTIRSKFSKGIDVPTDNSVKYNMKTAKTEKKEEGKASRRRARAEASAAKIREARKAEKPEDTDVTPPPAPEPEPGEETPPENEAGEETPLPPPEENDPAPVPQEETKPPVEPAAPPAPPAGDPPPVKKQRRPKGAALQAKLDKARELLQQNGYEVTAMQNEEAADLHELHTMVIAKLWEASKLLEAADKLEVEAEVPTKEVFIKTFKEMVQKGEITLQDLIS